MFLLVHPSLKSSKGVTTYYFAFFFIFLPLDDKCPVGRDHVFYLFICLNHCVFSDYLFIYKERLLDIISTMNGLTESSHSLKFLFLNVDVSVLIL